MSYDQFPDNFLPGLTFDKPDPRDHAVDMAEMGMVTQPLPPDFSIFKAPINYKLGPNGVFNQGSISTCVPNAIAQAYLYELQRQGVEYGDYVPSRLFLYFVVRYASAAGRDSAQFYENLRSPGTFPPGDAAAQLDDSGCAPRNVIKIMRALGAPAEDADISAHQEGSGKWPYDGTVEAINHKFKPTDWAARLPEQACFNEAVRHQALGYARPGDRSVECWKRCIQRGYPIVYGAKLYDSFWQWGGWTTGAKANDSIWPVPQPGEGYKDRRHALLAVGWDDNKKAPGTSSAGAFYIQNSWGSAWGDNGFSWMPYEWLAFNDGEQDQPWAVDSPWTFMHGGKPEDQIS
jgi:hypothetical protein